MGAEDAASPHCLARGCIYAAEPHAQNILCIAHWEKVPRYLQLMLLRAKHGGPEWMRLGSEALKVISRAEARARFVRRDCLDVRRAP